MSVADGPQGQETTKKKFDLAVIFALCGVLFSLLIFLFMFKQERDAAIQRFQMETAQSAASFQQRLTQNIYALDTLQAVYQLEPFEQSRLEQTAHSLFSRHLAIQALVISSGDINLQIAAPTAHSLLSEAEVINGLANLSLSDQEQVSTLTLTSRTYALVSKKLEDNAQLTALIALEGVIKTSQIEGILADVQFSLKTKDNSVIVALDNPDLAIDAGFAVPIQVLNLQPWTLNITATETRIAAGMSYTPALFLMTGLLLSFLVASYLKRIGRHLNKLRLEQANMNEQIAESTWSDPLTGLVNRLHFDEALDVECRRAVREFSPITMMLLKIDAFDEYSEKYGIEAAQEMLQEVSSVLKNSVGRPGDMIARVDGHLFAFLLPSTNELVIQLAERCCEVISNHSIPHEASPVTDVVTLSIGVATMQPTRLLTAEYLMELALQQLQQAETNGGNQYHAFADGIKEPPLTYNV